jgi:hypothetical protein
VLDKVADGQGLGRPAAHRRVPDGDPQATELPQGIELRLEDLERALRGGDLHEVVERAARDVLVVVVDRRGNWQLDE